MNLEILKHQARLYVYKAYDNHVITESKMDSLIKLINDASNNYSIAKNKEFDEYYTEKLNDAKCSLVFTCREVYNTIKSIAIANNIQL